MAFRQESNCAGFDFVPDRVAANLLGLDEDALHGDEIALVKEQVLPNEDANRTACAVGEVKDGKGLAAAVIVTGRRRLAGHPHLLAVVSIRCLQQRLQLQRVG